MGVSVRGEHMRRVLITMTVMSIVLWNGLRTSPALAGEVRVPAGPSGLGISVPLEINSVIELREHGITLQQLDYSCGSAALSTLFTSYLNQPYSESEIIDFITMTGDLQKIIVRKGFSLLDLKRFAESHGVKADGYELDFDSLVEFQSPVLVPLTYKDQALRHFVIVRGYKDDRVFLADPAQGRQTMLRAEFEALWQPKVGMVFSHTENTPAERSILDLGPDDAMYLSSESLRVVVTQSANQFIHSASEF